MGALRDKLASLDLLVRHSEESLSHLPDHIAIRHVEDIQRAFCPPCSPADDPMMSLLKNHVFRKGKSYVYVLRLEDSCFYVGFTENVVERMHSHFTCNGSTWTRLHKAVEVVRIEEGDKTKEKDVTLEMMRTHGWEKVRGSMWCRADMRSPPPEL